MSNEKTISLKEAKRQFLALVNGLSKIDKSDFITHVFEELTSCEDEEDDLLQNDVQVNNEFELLDDPVRLLNTIAEDLRKKVPLNAILPSESITSPETGENSDCLPDLTEHVDDFLYNENDVEELVDDGKLKRYFCKDCGSKNIEPLIFISHSLSRDALYYIFSVRLPTLDNKTVLDIGSRLGAVLYGAYAFTDASQIIGIEMNEDLCKLQLEMVEKYKMGSRISILHKRVEESPKEVKSADVIVINNAFEFYNSLERQVQIWEFLREHIKKGTILVTSPHLETTFKNLKPNIILEEWVKIYRSEEEEAPFGNDILNSSMNFCDIEFYQVL